MNAAELAILLDHVDPTAEIILGHSRGPATHVSEVTAQPRGFLRPRRGVSTFADLLDPGRFEVPRLRLAGTVIWWEPAPPFELRGRWRGARELERRLDALDGIG